VETFSCLDFSSITGFKMAMIMSSESIPGESIPLSMHKRDSRSLAIFKIHFLLGVLEISNAHQGVWGRNDDKGLNAHSGKDMEDEHGLLFRKFTESK
jgi:hypothetical protein